MSCLRKVRDDGFLVSEHFKDFAAYLQGCLDSCDTKKDKSIRVTMAVVLEALSEDESVLDTRESRTVFRVVRNEEEDVAIVEVMPGINPDSEVSK